MLRARLRALDANGKRSEMPVSCRSTTRCRSLATWSPWGGKCRDILIAFYCTGEIWCLRLSGEMEGGEPISHLYFQPFKYIKRPCYK